MVDGKLASHLIVVKKKKKTSYKKIVHFFLLVATVGTVPVLRDIAQAIDKIFN